MPAASREDPGSQLGRPAAGKQRARSLRASQPARPAWAALPRLALAVALAAAMALPLAGCRDTDVLTDKVIGEPHQYPVDELLAPFAEHDPDVASTTAVEESDSNIQNNAVYDKPDYGTDPTTDEATSLNRKNEHASGQATEGQDASERDRNDLSDDGQQPDPSSGEGDDAGDGDGGTRASTKPAPLYLPLFGDSGSNAEGPSNSTQTGPSGGETQDPEPDPGSAGGGGTKGQAYGETGNYSRVPMAGSIAAAGPYAVIVQSLGGKGALGAVNAKWYDDLPAGAYGKGTAADELEAVAKLGTWGPNADGTAIDAATVDAIVESGVDALLVSDSYGGSLTPDLAQRLYDAGINVVSMPVIGVDDALDSQIVLAVQVVGAMLDASGLKVGNRTPGQMAELWVEQYHDKALADAKRLNGGLSPKALVIPSAVKLTFKNQACQNGSPDLDQVSPHASLAVYIDSWAPLSPAATATSGSRSSAGDYHPWPVGNSGSWYESYAEGMGYYGKQTAPYHTAAANEYLLIDYYLQHGGATDIMAGAQYGESAHGAASIFAYAPSAYGQDVPVMDRYLHGEGASGSLGYRPGTADLPTLIVRDKAIADRVLASAAVYDAASRVVGVYNHGLDYNVVVMPAGVAGSWVDGGFESFLVAPWTYCVYQLGGDLSSLTDGYINGFYSTFYRCGASGILDGGGNWGTDTGNGQGCGGYGYVKRAICKTS